MIYRLDYLYSDFAKTALEGAQRHFTGCPDDMTVVLKGHLMVEKLMRDFCVSQLPNPEYFVKAKLGFSQLALITRSIAVCPSVEDDGGWLWGAVNRLNSVRNLYAHNLDPDAGKLEGELEKLRCSLNSIQSVEEPDWAGRMSWFVGMFSTYMYLSAQENSE
ncbi:hypothetical protein AAEO47_06830 [Pseudomonas aeruginosa]|uniref:hypothetical protein n=1 Tax=Pseudomonas aeruginosa TaxID=287 RepID=UPI003134253C